MQMVLDDRRQPGLKADEMRRPSGSIQRAQGEGRIGVRSQNGQTSLATLYQAGCAKIRLPKIYGGNWVEAVFLNTSGGLTDGDQVSFSADVDTGAELVATSQACERVYRAVSRTPARVENTITVAAGASCAWLPQETILFDGGRIARTLSVTLDEGASFLACETVVLGRLMSGETIRSGLFQDRWRIQRGGRLVFADETMIDGDVAAAIAGTGTLGGAEVFSTLLSIGGDDGTLLDRLRAVAADDVIFGASDLGNGLVVRLVARSSQAMRQAVVPMLSILRGGRSLPRVWSI